MQGHQRRCLEAWYINSAHAPLNRDDGGLLPKVYLYILLIGNVITQYEGIKCELVMSLDEDAKP